MKHLKLTLLLLSINCSFIFGQEKYENDFESLEIDSFPKAMMEIDGIFKVRTSDSTKAGNRRYLEMSAEPLSENAVIFGPSVKKSASVQAKIKGFRKRRSYPRFGIGLHGISGYRLRVVPSKKVIELVKNEEPVKSVPYKWTPDQWVNLRLKIQQEGKTWKISGSAWSDDSKAPESELITHIHEGSPGQGKASLWGTAYSGKVIQFDDLFLEYIK
ncbi:hypothetical protein OAL09_06550 [Verrucomicrobia bacterium]|nr:hypothetical protein [Verrucomicrobiota bacterium]NCG26881.1 hypothetical protein [Verrucomicrobiales bacterium]